MKPRYRTYILFISVLWAVSMLPTGCRSEEEIAERREIIQTARQWLQYIDQGQYRQGWYSSSKTMQGLISVEDWQTYLMRNRPADKNTLSRKINSIQKTRVLYGQTNSEKGLYYLIEYDTVIEGKEPFKEMIYMQPAEKGWQVALYRMKISNW